MAMQSSNDIVFDIMIAANYYAEASCAINKLGSIPPHYRKFFPLL